MSDYFEVLELNRGEVSRETGRILCKGCGLWVDPIWWARHQNRWHIFGEPIKRRQTERR